jgi:anti-sigma regulatory factor (Ser/Thr protein kinase)
MTACEATHELGSSPESVGRSRAIVRDVGAGLPGDVLDDAELLVSELVSNAVRHGGSGIRIRVHHDGAMLTVCVYDEGAGLPAMGVEAPDPAAASGRGLRMVEQLSRRWGVEVNQHGPGKAVWFQLAEAALAARSEDSNDMEETTAWSS